MRIAPLVGPSPQRSAGKTRRAADGSFAVERGGGDAREGAAAITGSTPLASFEAVLAIQAEPDDAARKDAALARGSSLLEALETIRIGLIEGAYSEASIRELRARLAQRGETTDDPALDALLREVETRAAVELAKIERQTGFAEA